MGESDVQMLHQAVIKMQQTLDELKKELADTRVLLVGTYVTRSDFIKCQECAEERIVKLHEKIEKLEQEERATRWKLAGIVFTVSAFVFSIIQWAVKLAGDR